MCGKTRGTPWGSPPESAWYSDCSSAAISPSNMAAEDGEAGADRSKGFLGSIKALLDSLLDLLQVRLELISTELEEELQRLKETSLLAIITLFFASLGIIF